MLNNRPILLVLIAMFAFAMMAFFTREANASVLAVATWRAILVAGIFGVAAFTKKEVVTVWQRDHLRTSIPYGLFLALASSTFVGGYTFTTVANTIFLHNLAPLFTIPVAWYLFSEKVDSNVIAGAVLSLLGVALISGVSIFHVSHFSNPKFLLGDGLSFVSALGYAGVLVWTKKSRREELPIVGTLFVAWLTAALALIVITLFFGSLSISLTALLWVLGLAFFCTCVPFYLLNQGMKEVSTGMASLLSMSEVLFATMLGALVYQESLAPIGWIGGGLVALGVLYPFLQPEKKEEEAAERLVPEAWLYLRHQRAGGWLLLLNGAALWGVYNGEYLPAIVTLTFVLRLSPASLNALLDDRFKTFQSVVLVAIGSCILYALLYQMTFEALSMLWLIPVTLLWWFEREWRLQEQACIENDHCPVEVDHSSALILPILGMAIIAGQLQHNCYAVLYSFSLLLLGTCTIENILGAVFPAYRKKKSRLRPPPVQWFVAAGAMIYVVGGIHIVPAGHQALVERFGELQKQQDAGLLIQFPPPIDHVHIASTAQLRSLPLWEKRQDLLCGDQSMISIQGSVRYSIASLQNFSYQTKTPEMLLLQEARGILVNAMRQLPQEKILGMLRQEQEEKWLQHLQNRSEMLGLGIQVEAFQLTEVSVPSAVQDAFLDVISATEDKKSMINQAEAYTAASLPDAFGEAVIIDQHAQEEAMYIQAKSIEWTNRHQAIYEGAGQSLPLVMDNLRLQSLASTVRNPIIKNTSHTMYVGDIPSSIPSDIAIEDNP